jgi:hypothetical protein
MRFIIILIILAATIADLIFISIGKVWCAILFVIIPLAVVAMCYDKIFKTK